MVNITKIIYVCYIPVVLCVGRRLGRRCTPVGGCGNCTGGGGGGGGGGGNCTIGGSGNCVGGCDGAGGCDGVCDGGEGRFINSSDSFKPLSSTNLFISLTRASGTSPSYMYIII